MAFQKLRFLLGTGLLSICVTGGLIGCATAPQYTDTERELSNTMGKDSFQPANRALRDGIETQDKLAQAAFWMREYDLNPGDLEAAIKLSAAIRKIGNPQRAVEITQTTRALYPRDPYLAAEYAASLIASERSVDAMQPLDEALAYAPAYGRLWSLKGAALDQQENYELARKHYARALEITPNDPSVMSNLGLSYALSGDPVTAESWLRRAVAVPGSSQSARQNLALVLQIQGKNEEAEQMARLAQGQYSPKLPDLNAQPAQKLRSASPATPSRQNASQSSGFTSPPPKVTVQNSPSVNAPAVQSPGQAATRSYSSIQSASPNPAAPQTRSASDAARLAAQQSGQRPQRDVITPQQQQAQQDILARLAGNVGAKPANPALRQTQTASQYQSRKQAEQASPYYPGRADPSQAPSQPQPSATYQGQPSQAYSTPQSGGQPYPPQPQEPRGASRDRR